MNRRRIMADDVGMRTLVGIDRDRLYGAALVLLGRLGFAENHVTLAHIGPAVGAQLSPVPLVYAYYDAGELAAVAKRVGTDLLQEATDVACASGIDSVESVYEIGSSSVQLMRLADERRVDLVAIGSGQHGAVESFFLGSVGRALAIGAHQSFLISRREGNSTGPLKAVFATDHSEYANRCFSRLIDMNPEGLKHVTIVTATESNLLATDDHPELSLTEVEETMTLHGEEMVERLQATGRTAEFRLIEGFPAEAIAKAMTDTDADLLILGARGHGLIERVFIGSLALHAVVAEPYSVLVIRIPEVA
ncbi:hypothetical protein EON82_09540 [bacterium]|nr:MAG: hypothetical protein EON82_09540 [bacterium]